MNYEQILYSKVKELTPEQLEALQHNLMPELSPEVIEEQSKLYNQFKNIHVELPKGADMVIFTDREVHMIEIVMRLLRRRKIFTHTPNMEVYDMVKKEYYNDIHKG